MKALKVIKATRCGTPDSPATYYKLSVEGSETYYRVEAPERKDPVVCMTYTRKGARRSAQVRDQKRIDAIVAVALAYTGPFQSTHLSKGSA